MVQLVSGRLLAALHVGSHCAKDNSDRRSEA